MSRWILSAVLVLAGLAVIGVSLKPATADDDAEDKQAEDTEREVDLKVISDPSHDKMNREAPAEYEVLFKTTAGDFTVAVTRAWAPIGADRFYNLVRNGYYDGNKFFRVVPGFVVQWGIHGDKTVNAEWYDEENEKAVNLKDDPVKQSNTRGRITFANAGPNTRSTQVFINYGNNTRLDDPAAMRGSVFAPFGEVTGEGMKVVDKLFGEYPAFDPRFDRDPTKKVSQDHIVKLGNGYLDEHFPKLDGIITATIVEKGDTEEDKGE